jgi:hypothetical protein
MIKIPFPYLRASTYSPSRTTSVYHQNRKWQPLFVKFFSKVLRPWCDGINDQSKTADFYFPTEQVSGKSYQQISVDMIVIAAVRLF